MKQFLKYLLPFFIITGPVAEASFLVPNGSITRQKLAVGGIGNQKVTSATSTYSVLTTDDYVSMSGASFTTTLFTAVGNEGRIITLAHNGISLTQVFTLNTIGGQTIGGISSGVYKLFTNGETLRLISDNTNWLILSHVARTPWTAFPSVAAGTLITATGSNPTYGTIALNAAYYMRDGQNVIIRWDYRQTTAGTNGTGLYLFNLPAGITADTSIVGANTGTSAGAAFYNSIVGEFTQAYGTTNVGMCATVSVYSTTQLKAVASYQSTGATTDAGVWGQTFQGFGAQAAQYYGLRAKFPVPSWQP